MDATAKRAFEICAEKGWDADNMLSWSAAVAIAEKEPSKVEPGKCRVPMWMGGTPSGFCDKEAFGPQLPFEVLYERRSAVTRSDIPYCHGPCCPAHGGPKADEIRIYQDGLTEQGRPMWCAVYPDFVNLQESPSGFDGNPLKAIANLKAASPLSPPIAE